MNAKKIIPFEIYIDNILNKEPSKILLELFPNLSHPSQSRFHEFFKKLKELNKIQENNDKKRNHTSYMKNKKNIMELNLYKIQNGMDKRTSLMIKNIPKGIAEINVIKWLQQLANMNYIFVPKDEFSNKILGFAFINVCNYYNPSNNTPTLPPQRISIPRLAHFKYSLYCFVGWSYYLVVYLIWIF